MSQCNCYAYCDHRQSLFRPNGECNCKCHLTYVIHEDNKTLRDEFVMAILTGIYSDPNTFNTPHDVLIDNAFRAADLAMKARENKGKE